MSSSLTVGKSLNVCILLTSMTLCMLPSVTSAVVCSAEQIRILDDVTGRVVGCMECKTCPAGSGPSVPCGGSVKVNIGVKCVPCVTGSDYSIGSSVNACEQCTNCGPHRTVTHKCNLTADAECGKCDKGFYLSDWTGFCERKQVFVGKSSHITVIPSPSPTPTNEKEPIKSTGSTIKGVTLKHNITTLEVSSKANNTTRYDVHKKATPVSQKNWFWLAICLPLACLLTLVIILICWCKCKQNVRQTQVHRQETVEMTARNVGQDQGKSPPVPNTEPHDMSCAPTQLASGTPDFGPTPV